MEKMMKKKLQRKPRRRTPRKKLLLPSDSPRDMAEARREIVNALHIHRSCSRRHHHDYKSQENTNAIATSSSLLHYPLAESVRLPEPIWLTTAPNSSVEADEQEEEEEVVLEEFDWPESNYVSSSSYTWWLGFLRSLDSNIYANHHQMLKTTEELSEVILITNNNNNNIMKNNNNENDPNPDFVGSYHEWFSSITSGSEDINEMLTNS